ncbi:DUF6843 domain-containing protein [Soonwooa purpurea]
MKTTLLLRYFGIGIMFLGIILNILMVINQAWPTYLYGILFLIGLCFFLIAKYFKNTPIFLQLLIIITPFLTYYIYYEINSSSKDIFLIPNGFRGKVVILYDQKNGTEKEYEGNFRVYKIPKNGILKTKFKVKGDSWDIGDAKYYFVNGNKRIPIQQYCLYCENEKIDTISVQSIPGEGGSFNQNANNLQTNYLSFYIDVPNKKFKPNNNIFQTLKLE